MHNLITIFSTIVLTLISEWLIRLIWKDTITKRDISKLLKSPKDWEQKSIDNKPIWFYKSDNKYTISISSDTTQRTVDMKYVEKFPDKSAFKTIYYLKFNDLILEEYDLIDLDGGRYTIPLPKHQMISEDEYNSFIEKDSRNYRVSKIINNFQGPYNSIEQVCDLAEIKII